MQGCIYNLNMQAEEQLNNTLFTRFEIEAKPFKQILIKENSNDEGTIFTIGETGHLLFEQISIYSIKAVEPNTEILIMYETEKSAS